MNKDYFVQMSIILDDGGIAHKKDLRHLENLGAD